MRNELYEVIVGTKKGEEKIKISAKNMSDLMEYLPRKKDSHIVDIRPIGKTKKASGLVKLFN